VVCARSAGISAIRRNSWKVPAQVAHVAQGCFYWCLSWHAALARMAFAGTRVPLRAGMCQHSEVVNTNKNNAVPLVPRCATSF
jgi:hypothetical protein